MFFKLSLCVENRDWTLNPRITARKPRSLFFQAVHITSSTISCIQTMEGNKRLLLKLHGKIISISIGISHHGHFYHCKIPDENISIFFCSYSCFYFNPFSCSSMPSFTTVTSVSVVLLSLRRVPPCTHSTGRNTTVENGTQSSLQREENPRLVRILDVGGAEVKGEQRRSKGIQSGVKEYGMRCRSVTGRLVTKEL